MTVYKDLRSGSTKIKLFFSTTNLLSSGATAPDNACIHTKLRIKHTPTMALFIGFMQSTFQCRNCVLLSNIKHHTAHRKWSRKLPLSREECCTFILEHRYAMSNNTKGVVPAWGVRFTRNRVCVCVCACVCVCTHSHHQLVQQSTVQEGLFPGPAAPAQHSRNTAVSYSNEQVLLIRIT